MKDRFVTPSSRTDKELGNKTTQHLHTAPPHITSTPHLKTSAWYVCNYFTYHHHHAPRQMSVNVQSPSHILILVPCTNSIDGIPPSHRMRTSSIISLGLPLLPLNFPSCHDIFCWLSSHSVTEEQDVSISCSCYAGITKLLSLSSSQGTALARQYYLYTHRPLHLYRIL